jgi:hypothetical protein
MIASDSNTPGAFVLYQMWHHARDSKVDRREVDRREVDRRVCWLRARAPIIVNMHSANGGTLIEAARSSEDYVGAKYGANQPTRHRS